jgi:hypothetical protein
MTLHENFRAIIKPCGKMPFQNYFNYPALITLL